MAETKSRPWWRRLTTMLRRSDLVKASQEDLAWLEPGLGPVEAARVLLSEGPPLALITRGPDGATVVTAREEVDVAAAPPAQVVDTIGAGDASWDEPIWPRLTRW